MCADAPAESEVPESEGPETGPPRIDLTEPEPLRVAPEPEAHEPSEPERQVETPPAAAPRQPLPAPVGPPLPPIIAKAPNPKSLTGGYRLREHQFRFRAAMEEITGRKWQGAP